MSLVVLLGLTTTGLRAQDEDQGAQHRATLSSWLAKYKVGAIRMMSRGMVNQAEINKARTLMGAVAIANDLAGAQLLFKVATVDAKPAKVDASSGVDFYSELRVSQIRGIARAQIVGMDSPAVEEWLLTMARSKKGKGNHDAASPAGAALRILASRPGEKAREALLRSCRSFKPEVRAQAVNALSAAATLTMLPHFFDFVKDKEPYVRIAAINGICRALKEHTDETTHDKIDPAVAKSRDAAIDAIKKLLLRDRVWQVRAAARENLAMLKSKHVIPALIDGLAAELKRKKDPWSLDIRLHRTLEGLTGLKMPAGQVRVWQDFWKKEGATFKFVKAGMKKEDMKADAKYEKFFSINLESNRVMFVLDFSGSMVEKITLKSTGVGTAAAGGKRETTKAKLVVEELKKMVMSLKDGDLFNVVIFNDGVRIWKKRSDGRPALVKINDETRDDLLGGYLDNLMPSGLTNLYGALDAALGFGGRGLHDKYYALGYDTLYVLSDGAPTAGKITDTEEILRAVRETNKLRRLTINTITFGQLNEVEFLEKLAKQNGGRHVHVE